MSKDDRYLTVLTLLFAAAAVIAFPAATSNPGALLFVFAGPMTVATTGRLRRSPQRRNVAVALGILAFASVGLLLTTGTTLPVEVALLAGGPIALVVAGRMVREHDRLASVVWTALCGSAYLLGVGLATSGVRGTGALPLPIAVATAFAGLRIARRWRANA